MDLLQRVLERVAKHRRKHGIDAKALRKTLQGSPKDRDEAIWAVANSALKAKKTPWGVTEDSGPYNMQNGAPVADLTPPASDPGSARPKGADMVAAIQARVDQKKRQKASGLNVDLLNSIAIVRDNQTPDIDTANPGQAMQMPPDLR